MDREQNVLGDLETCLHTVPHFRSVIAFRVQGSLPFTYRVPTLSKVSYEWFKHQCLCLDVEQPVNLAKLNKYLQ
jgi:hypothetical protein